MELIIQRDKEAAALLAARIVANELRANPHAVLGLATGNTMEAVYRHLVRMHREQNLDFSKCNTFNLDEYVGLAATDPNSYRYFMNKHLFMHVNIKLENTHLPDGRAADLGAECRNYEALIARTGGIDLQLLGIGRSGHIGFNEPLSALRSRTREKHSPRRPLNKTRRSSAGKTKCRAAQSRWVSARSSTRDAAYCSPRVRKRRASSLKRSKGLLRAWSLRARCNYINAPR